MKNRIPIILGALFLLGVQEVSAAAHSLASRPMAGGSEPLSGLQLLASHKPEALAVRNNLAALLGAMDIALATNPLDAQRTLGSSGTTANIAALKAIMDTTESFFAAAATQGGVYAASGRSGSELIVVGGDITQVWSPDPNVDLAIFDFLNGLNHRSETLMYAMTTFKVPVKTLAQMAIIGRELQRGTSGNIPGSEIGYVQDLSRTMMSLNRVKPLSYALVRGKLKRLVGPNPAFFNALDERVKAIPAYNKNKYADLAKTYAAAPKSKGRQTITTVILDPAPVEKRLRELSRFKITSGVCIQDSDKSEYYVLRILSDLRKPRGDQFTIFNMAASDKDTSKHVLSALNRTVSLLSDISNKDWSVYATPLKAVAIQGRVLEYTKENGWCIDEALGWAREKAIAANIANTLATGGRYGIDYDRVATQDEFRMIYYSLSQAVRFYTTFDTLADAFKLTGLGSLETKTQNHRKNMFVTACMAWSEDGRNVVYREGHNMPNIDLVSAMSKKLGETDQDVLDRIDMLDQSFGLNMATRRYRNPLPHDEYWAV